MAEEKQMQQIRAAIEKSKGKTQTEKEVNYFKDILQKLEKAIPAYLPDDKGIKGYTYPSHLPDLGYLRVFLYRKKLKSDEDFDFFDDVRKRITGFQIRHFNYEIEKLKSQKPTQPLMIKNFIIHSEFLENVTAEICINHDLSSTDHLLIAKRYFDLFYSQPHVRSYQKCRKHLNFASQDQLTAQPAREMLNKLLGLRTTSDPAKNFYDQLSLSFMVINTAEKLAAALKDLESAIPERRDLELYNSYDEIFHSEAVQYSPASLVELLCSSKEEGGVGLCLWDQTIKDKAYSFEARALWNQQTVADANLKKVKEQKSETSLSEQAVIFLKYYFLLHEAVDRVFNRACLDPEIRFYFSKLSTVTKEAKHIYVPHSWIGNVAHVTQILSGKEEPSHLDVVDYPKSSNIRGFDEFRNRIFSEGQKLCKHLQEKKLEVKQLAGKIAELQKVNVIDFLKPGILGQILALETLIKEVLNTSKDSEDRKQLRGFFRNCRELREEIVSIRNTYIFHDPRSNEQVQNKQVKDELKNGGMGLKAVAWISQQNFQSVLGAFANNHIKPQASSSASLASLDRVVDRLLETQDITEQAEIHGRLDAYIDNLSSRFNQNELNNLEDLISPLQKLVIKVEKFRFLRESIDDLVNNIQKKLKDHPEAKGKGTSTTTTELQENKQGPVSSSQKSSAPLSAPPERLQLLNSQKNKGVGAVDPAQKDVSSVVPKVVGQGLGGFV